MATTENNVAVQDESRNLPAPTNTAEIDTIRQQGSNALARQKEINKISRAAEGLAWGSVHGSSMTPHARYALAEFCYVTRANIQTHIDILGNRPYLNARFWEDLVNAHEHYIGYTQENISATVSKRLRSQAEAARNEARQMLADARDLGDDGAALKQQALDRFTKAAEMESRAHSIDLERAEWGAPDGEKSQVYVTTIRRYSPLAPVDEIKAGTIENPELWIQVISECNWAGEKNNDPVGTQHAALTARTRSFRRAAVKAFSAYLGNRAEEIERAEQIIEAEFEVIKTERAENEAIAAAPALRSGSGEPQAAHARDAQPLPVEEVGSGQANGNGGVPPELKAINGEYFGALRKVGIGDRKAWQQQYGLGESVQKWARENYDFALALLKAEEGARAIGFGDLAALCTAWSAAKPECVADVEELLSAISAAADRE